MRKWDSGSLADLPFSIDETSVRVRYADTDAMGWVYYAIYLVYFEVGRTELIRRTWRSYREIEDGGMRLPVVQAGCRYIYGARYDDLLKIRSRMTLPTAYRVRFDYEIDVADGARKIAEGFTEHCFVDASGKLLRIPKDLQSALSR